MCERAVNLKNLRRKHGRFVHRGKRRRKIPYMKMTYRRERRKVQKTVLREKV